MTAPYDDLAIQRKMIETLERTAREEIQRLMDSSTSHIDTLRDSLHSHARKLSKIEGVMEERTTHLKEADAEARRDITSLRSSIEDFRREMSKDMKLLSTQVTEGRVKLGIVMGISASLFGGISATVIQIFFQ